MTNAKIQPFRALHQVALKRHGEAGLAARIPKPKSARALASLADDRFLSAMAKCIFQAGFVWQVVENMWPRLEEAFQRFSPAQLVALPPKAVEALKQDQRIIRNPQKIKAVLDNARFVQRISGEQGGFGKFLAAWPETDIVALWQLLAKQGSRLGGATGPRFLRSVGKDTFILTPDVIAALNRAGVLDGEPTTKGQLAACQAAFNRWREESGRPLCELSMIAACSV